MKRSKRRLNCAALLSIVAFVVFLENTFLSLASLAHATGEQQQQQQQQSAGSELLAALAAEASNNNNNAVESVVATATTATTTNSLNSAASEYLQHNNNLHFFVPENVPNGTVVGTIRSAGDQVPYLVVPSKVNPTPEEERLAAFYVNLSTGELLTNGPLDRERRDSYHFVAIIERPFTEIQCVVTVKDVNDNAPMFLLPTVQQQQQQLNSAISSSNSAQQQVDSSNQFNGNNNNNHYVIEVPENARGIRRMLPLAIDADSPQFGIKEFRIVSGNTPSSTFVLVEHEAPLLQSNLIASAADERGESAATLIGADNPQLMQQLAQQASVLIPSQPHFTSSATSTATTTTTITTAPQSNIAHSRFQIDLEVSKPLDRENQSSYQFVVEAIDGGQPPLIGQLRVTVIVQDVNDNDPVFTKKLYECHFKEDTPKGTLLLRVHASDADLDANAQISYYIKRHSSSSSQSMSQNGVGVNLISNSSDPNDAIATNTPQQQLSARFNQQQVKQTTSTAAAAAQQQTRLPSLQVVSSSAATGSSTSTINKQRGGGGGNGGGSQSPAQQVGGNEIFGDNSTPHNGLGSASNEAPSHHKTSKFSTYGSNNAANSAGVLSSSSLSGEHMFEMDPLKGELYLMHPLDYETDQMHEIIIEARDHGKPSRSAYASVKVFVIDVNDDPPPMLPRMAGSLAAAADGSIGSNLVGHIGLGADGADRKSIHAPLGLEMGRGAGSAADLASGSNNGSEGGSSSSSSSSQLAHYLSSLNLVNWLGQQNSLALFAIISAALSAVAFLHCFVKIKSRQPESDYNDTAGLTLNSNNGTAGQTTKSSPNYSVNNIPSSNGTSDSLRHHQHHHDHHQVLGSPRMNGSFAGLVSVSNGGLGGVPGAGLTGNNLAGTGSGSFGSPASGKMRYQYIDSSNLYHNPYPTPHFARPLSQQHSTSTPPPSTTHHHLSQQQVASSSTPPPSATNTLHHHHSLPTCLAVENNDAIADGSYNWDYLNDWTPEYHTLMQLIQTGYR